MMRIALKPSYLLATTMSAAHAAAALILLPLDVTTWIKLVALALIAASLTHALLQYAFLRTGASLVAVELRENDTANVLMRNGNWHQARILPTTYVSAVLTVVNVRVPPRIFACHMVIAPDSLGAEDFRCLRVWLRWKYRQEA